MHESPFNSYLGLCSLARHWHPDCWPYLMLHSPLPPLNALGRGGEGRGYIQFFYIIFFLVILINFMSIFKPGKNFQEQDLLKSFLCLPVNEL